jgi:hypothetical protein
MNNWALATCVYCGEKFMSRGEPHCWRSNCKWRYRQEHHDSEEEKTMNVIRPFTDRHHLPDRWVSFNGKLCAWDLKTNVFVEDNSHDEYFRLFKQDKIPVFIVYIDQGQELANWIQSLRWDGPNPPSPNSTCGDSYYRISGGIPLQDFLDLQKV